MCSFSLRELPKCRLHSRCASVKIGGDVAWLYMSLRTEETTISCAAAYELLQWRCVPLIFYTDTARLEQLLRSMRSSASQNRVHIWSTMYVSMCVCTIESGSRDSVVGIAACYGLDGPGIESRWGGEIFLTYPDRLWGPPSLLYSWYRVFPGDKAAGEWRWPPTPI